MDEVSKKLRSASLELCRAQELCLSNQNKPVEGSLKLINKIKAEKKFLKKLESGKKKLDASHISSSNLKNLKAILDAISCIGSKNITRILFPVTCAEEFPEEGELEHSINVDIVASSGHMWVKVIARNPAALLANACGKGDFGSRSLIDIGRVFLLAAEQNQTDYQKPYVVFYFADGVPLPLAKSLMAMGIVVNGAVFSEDESSESSYDDSDDVIFNDYLDNDDAEFSHNVTSCKCQDCEKAQSDECELSSALCPLALACILSHRCNTLKQLVLKIHTLRIASSSQSKTSNDEKALDNNFGSIDEANLDVTALLALVSNLSNGSANCMFESTVLKEHAAQERKTPVMPALNEVLANKRLVACQTAVVAFQNIVATIGGVEETKRTQELLERVQVVDDEPSERCLALRKSSKINRRALIIFGTGDKRKAVTVTANSGFIRAAAQSGVKLTTYEHQARALTENKEQHN